MRSLKAQCVKLSYKVRGACLPKLNALTKALHMLTIVARQAEAQLHLLLHNLPAPFLLGELLCTCILM